MNWAQTREVALREIRTRGRSRGYRWITGLMLVAAVAAPVLFAVIPSPTDDLRSVAVGLMGMPADLNDQLTTLAAERFELTIVDLDDASQERIADQLERGRVDVVVRPPATLVWHETEDSAVTSLVTTALQQNSALRRADELGIDFADLSAVFAPVDVQQEFIGESSNTETVRSAVAFFGLFLAFLIPQVFGQFTMMGVIEEKSTRVVEILLSQIRPVTLLAGKILGVCALALVQLAVIVGGLVASLLSTNFFDVPASVWEFVPLLTLSVLGGLVIYTTLFALLGSLISRQEDQAQIMLPVFGPLMLGYFVGQSVVFGQPDTVLVKLLTWFPLTSPMLLPPRVARDAIGAGEIVLSFALLAIASFLMFRLAARAYEFTLLRTGSRVGWRELIRLSRGSVTD